MLDIEVEICMEDLATNCSPFSSAVLLFAWLCAALLPQLTFAFAPEAAVYQRMTTNA